MPKERTPLRRRVAPGVSLTLKYSDGDVSFRLAYNNNALASIEERTEVFVPQEDGTMVKSNLNLLANPYALWEKLGKNRLGVIFWAALLQDRPELDSDIGLLTVRSYLDRPENELKVFNAAWEAFMLYLPKDQAEGLRAARADWEKKRDAGDPPEPAATVPTPPAPGPELTASNPLPGSSSGPSPDSTSDSPIAISAS
jgi:hypothetical protein